MPPTLRNRCVRAGRGAARRAAPRTLATRVSLTRTARAAGAQMVWRCPVLLAAVSVGVGAAATSSGGGASPSPEAGGTGVHQNVARVSGNTVSLGDVRITVHSESMLRAEWSRPAPLRTAPASLGSIVLSPRPSPTARMLARWLCARQRWSYGTCRTTRHELRPSTRFQRTQCHTLGPVPST